MPESLLILSFSLVWLTYCLLLGDYLHIYSTTEAEQPVTEFLSNHETSAGQMSILKTKA